MSEPPPSASTRSWRLLAVCGLAYLVLFGLFYPPTHGIEDEVGFLNQTLVLSRGALSSEGAGLEPPANFVAVGDRHVGWRNPGRPLVTAPFWAIGGYAAVFASGALIHLLTAWVCALTLARLGRDPLWAILVLFHPTLLLFSRTVMADGLGGLGVAVAFWALVRGGKRAGLYAGLALGAATLARYQLAVLVPFAALAAWRRPEAEAPRRDALGLLVGAGVWGVAIAIYNVTVLGGVLGTTSQGFFAARFLGPNALHYGLALLLLWPGMIAAPALLDLRLRGMVLALTLPLLVLLCGYYWCDQRPAWIETVVVGQRLLQPVLPVWIVAYAVVLAERAPAWTTRPRARRVGLLACAAVLLVGTVLMFRRHQGHLERLVAIRAAFVARVPPGSLVLANPSLTKLFEVPEGADVPGYRFAYYHYQGAARSHEARVAAERAPVYVAHLAKAGSAPPPVLDDVVSRLRAERLEAPARLLLYRTPPRE